MYPDLLPNILKLEFRRSLHHAIIRHKLKMTNPLFAKTIIPDETEQKLMFKYPSLFSYYDFRLTLSLRAWLIFSLFLLSLFILFSFVYLLFILFRFPELPDEDKATA